MWLKIPMEEKIGRELRTVIEPSVSSKILYHTSKLLHHVKMKCTIGPSRKREAGCKSQCYSHDC